MENSNLQGIRYDTYCMGKKEWLIYSAQGVLYLALLTFVFYRSMGLFLAVLPVGFAYPLVLRKDLKKKRLETLAKQCRDAVLAVSAGLNAGYSVENAFSASLTEMERVYGSDAMICTEIRLLLSKVRLNRTFEEAFGDLAVRSGLEDIRNFAEVFLAARRSGGELMKIISRTADIIGEKIRIQEDILTATASRRLEQRFMSAIPFLIVFYIELTSPGFFGILYTTLTGRLLMTVCLAVFLAAQAVSKRILEIEV